MNFGHRVFFRLIWIAIILGGLSLSCALERDNTWDQRRCVSVCPLGQVCYEGQCVYLDWLTFSDALADQSTEQSDIGRSEMGPMDGDFRMDAGATDGNDGSVSIDMPRTDKKLQDQSTSEKSNFDGVKPDGLKDGLKRN